MRSRRHHQAASSSGGFNRQATLRNDEETHRVSPRATLLTIGPDDGTTHNRGRRPVEQTGLSRSPGQDPGVRTAASTDRAQLLDAIERDGIEFLFAMFVDLHGKPCAKLVPA